MNGAGPRAYSSTTELRQYYNAATRAFLVRDYQATASALHDALALVQDIPQRAWFDYAQRGEPVPLPVTLRRRLDVLQITFLATVRSSPAALAPTPALAPLLDLPPAGLVKALWSSLIDKTDGLSAARAASAAGEILPTPTASHLHPSFAVALVLAALKLDEPKSARAVAEAWLGSIDEEVEALVEDTARGMDWADASELALDAVSTGSGNSGMGASGSLSATSTTGFAHAQDPHRQLLAAWLKLVDLLVLHVLPQLGEWEAASDFVRIQSVENGGWVPDQRVEATLARLKEIQHEQVHLAAMRSQRQKALDAARIAASSSAAKRRSTSGSGSDKGKSRAVREGSPTHSSGSSTSSPNSKKGRRRRGSEAAHGKADSTGAQASDPGHANGFAGLRDSLSLFLHPKTPANGVETSSATGSPAPPVQGRSVTRSPLRKFVDYVVEHYSADPVRLLSMVCFTFAVLTWARRRVLYRRLRGKNGLGMGDLLKLVAGRVGESFGMMTKITAM